MALGNAGHGQQVLQILVELRAPFLDKTAVQIGAQEALGGQLQLVLEQVLQAPVQRLKVAVSAGKEAPASNVVPERAQRAEVAVVGGCAASYNAAFVPTL